MVIATNDHVPPTLAPGYINGCLYKHERMLHCSIVSVLIVNVLIVSVLIVSVLIVSVLTMLHRSMKLGVGAEGRPPGPWPMANRHGGPAQNFLQNCHAATAVKFFATKF